MLTISSSRSDGSFPPFIPLPELVNMRYIRPSTPPESSRRAKWRGGQCSRHTPTTSGPGTGTTVVF
jgi:hypothetical protein